MPTLEEFLAQGKVPSTLEEFLASKPGLGERFGTHALSRTADIADFLESPAASIALPGLFAGRKIREFFGSDEGDEREALRAEAAALPAPESFGEKAADFAGNVAPDVALGIGTAGVSAAGAGLAAARGVASPFMRLLAGEALQSAALAPIEFGTRDPASAAISTIAGPAIGTAVGRGISRLLGRGAAEALPEAVPPRLDEYGFPVDASPPRPSAPPPIAFEPLSAPQLRQAVKLQFGDTPIRLSTEDIVPGASPPPTALPPSVTSDILPFAQAARPRAQQRIVQALVERRPIRTGDLIELGDEEITAAAREAHTIMQQRSIAALQKVGVQGAQLEQAAQDLAETGLRLPPVINQEIADAVDSLPPEAAARFTAAMKAKGVCPI